MFKQFASAVKILTRRVQPGMSLKVRPDDTFLVSYPKSGNTWMRFLIANLLQQDPPVGLLDADCLIPIVDGKSKRFFDEMKSPRIIKSHFSFIPAYKRVIYVVRDPRDVVMSQYHYQIKRGVLEKDMLADATSGAVRISSFLGLGQDPARIATAIERSSLENMRNVEKAEGAKWDSTKGTRQDMSFFRSAKSGEGRAKLSRESLDRIEKAWGPLMQSVGYTVSSPTLVAAFSEAPMHT
jgi:Sulfotransferase domain